MIHFLTNQIKKIGMGVILLIIIFAVYFFFFKGDSTAEVTSAMVVQTVATGNVSTGIETTGTIVAAEILDLNVYKLTKRIDAVGIANGTHVDKGQLLFAFDQSDVAVDIAQSQIGVREAQLSLEVEKGSATDPNTTVTTLKNDIEKLETNLVQYDIDERTVVRTFLNSNLEAVPTTARYSEQIDVPAPNIGGLYSSQEQGEYLIEIYPSGEDSGLSYRLSGLETGTYPVVLGAETKLGTRGLKITFPNSGVGKHDEWIVAVANTHAPEYSKNLDTYNVSMTTLEENIQSDTVSLANKKVQLEQALREDTATQRDLGVESAALAIEKARVDLQKGYDTQDERRIVAPFSGTVEGIENVVVGATPTKDTNDSTDFGVLISDEFMTSFSLSSTDIDKIKMGQKVLVTITSLPNSTPLEATIVEISSLPDSSAVAEYGVLALIQNATSTSIKLRDGMLVDIEIVEEEAQDVVRVPTSAVTYVDGKATVTVIEGLTEQQKASASRLGIVRTDEGNVPTELKRAVEIGLRGQYYIEITSGLELGEIIKVTGVVTAATSVVQQAGFGPGSGGGHPDEAASAARSVK